MIDAAPSLQAANELTAPALAAYLLQNGWAARPSRVEGISILSKNVPGSSEAAEFILPIASGFSDEQRRIADALRTISAVENIAMRDIVHAVSALRSHLTENDSTAGSANEKQFKQVSEPSTENPKSSSAISGKMPPAFGHAVGEGSLAGGKKKGTVKFFNAAKGYGFIQPYDGGRDVFVHISAVERAGMKTLVEGQVVEFEVVNGRETNGIAASIVKKPA